MTYNIASPNGEVFYLVSFLTRFQVTSLSNNIIYTIGHVQYKKNKENPNTNIFNLFSTILWAKNDF